MIDFSIGQPRHEYFEKNLLRQWQDTTIDISEFFYYTNKSGYPKLKEKFVEILGTPKSTPQNVIITNGVLNAIDFVAKVLRENFNKVYVYNPTYKGALRIFNTYRIELHPIPVTSEGKTNFSQLQAEFDIKNSFFYIIPNLNNPDGRVLSLEEREWFKSFCLDYSIPLLEDDIYRDLFFSNVSYPTIFEKASQISEDHMIIRLMSLSKNFMPGLRVGFLESTPAFLQQLLKHDAGFGTSSVLSWLTCLLLKDIEGYYENIERFRSSLEKRKDYLLNHLKTTSSIIKWNNPKGGYFVWGEMPECQNAENLLSLALKNGVSFTPGSLFMVDGKKNYLRLSYGYLELIKIKKGVELLRQSLNEYIAQGSVP